MGADVAAEGEDCVEVYLDDLATQMLAGNKLLSDLRNTSFQSLSGN